MPNWRKIRNIITKEDSIGFITKEFPSGIKIHYKFKCLSGDKHSLLDYGYLERNKYLMEFYE